MTGKENGKNVWVADNTYLGVKKASVELEKPMRHVLGEAWTEYVNNHKHLFNQKVALSVKKEEEAVVDKTTASNITVPMNPSAIPIKDIDRP